MEQEILDKLGADWTHPVDILEPEEESIQHRDRIRLLVILNHAMSWIKAADDMEVGWWQVVYGLGLAAAVAPMSEVAANLGVERATISAGATSFVKALDLPPSPAMKSTQAAKTYAEIRKSQLR